MKKIFVFLVCILALNACSFNGMKIGQMKGQDLAQDTGSGQDIRRVWRDDFDGDGKKEAFIVAGTDIQSGHKIYFEGEKWSGKVYDEGWSAYYQNAKPICKVNDKQKLFVMEFGAYGSGSLSKCFYVDNGRPKEVDQDLEGLVQLGGKEFAIHPSAFDNGYDGTVYLGHTWKRYWLEWTGKNFCEHKGRFISEMVLMKYDNGKQILEEIRESGYDVDKIIYRDNGIININVHEEKDNCTMFENVTLKISENYLKEQKGPWYEQGDIVKKSTYGGIYKKSIMSDQWKE